MQYFDEPLGRNPLLTGTMNPQFEPVPSGDRPTSEIVSDMLKEPVPHSFLDSGSIYGYQYEKNTGVDFDTVPDFRVDLLDDGCIDVHKSLYAFLTEHLEYDHEMTRRFYDFAHTAPMEMESLLECSREFARKQADPAATYGVCIDNTHNQETTLSQEMHYSYFTAMSGKPYVVVSIHGGCDARGGYTKSKAFSFINNQDYEDFIIHMYDVTCRCRCGCVRSDDAGNNWYGEENFEDGWPQRYNMDSGKVFCTECKSEVSVY